jgi:hypothetical protein
MSPRTASTNYRRLEQIVLDHDCGLDQELNLQPSARVSSRKVSGEAQRR